MALEDGIRFALATSVGRVRSNNEDAVEIDRQLGLLILADGMGGYQAGEVASALAVATTLEVVRQHWPQLERADDSSSSTISHAAGLLQQALQTAHARICQMSRTQPQCAGMGTTAVACLLYDDRMSIAYVGDSRLYRWRDGQLQQLTRDHSLLEELVARGQYSRADATQLVGKNIVTRALGIEEGVSVDLLDAALQVGDIVLLCSDGLTDMLDDRTIGAILGTSAASADATAQALIEQANARGGRDNVSVALARIDAPFPRRPLPWDQRLAQHL